MIKRGKMDKTQKIIVVLLIVAILFSVVSIIISLSVSNVKFPEIKPVQPKSNSASAEIGFFIEGNNEGGGG